MEDKSRETGIWLANRLFTCFSPIFQAESFYNAAEMKRWLGEQIKLNFMNGYRNFSYSQYKMVCDVILPSEGTSIYRIGIDFGAQAIHVTLGPEDVHTLYFRNGSVSE